MENEIVRTIRLAKAINRARTKLGCDHRWYTKTAQWRPEEIEWNREFDLKEKGHRLNKRLSRFKAVDSIVNAISRVPGLQDFVKPIATGAGEKVKGRLFRPTGVRGTIKANPLMAYPLIVGGSLAAGAGVERVGGKVLSLLHEKATREGDFQQLLDSNPDLKKQYPAKAVRSAFETIRRYNKKISADPLVTGLLVRNAVASSTMQSGAPVFDLKTVNELIRAERDAIKPSVIGESVRRGMEKALPSGEL